jgi:hypothetical protein
MPNTFRFVLISVVAFAVTPPANAEVVSAQAPETAIAVDKQGVHVAAPGTRVAVDAQGVRVGAPGAGVIVNSEGIRVKAAGTEVSVDPAVLESMNVPTSVSDGRAANQTEPPAPVVWTELSVTGGLESHSCKAGEGVRIKGTGSVYTLSGPCDTVRVAGSANVVNISAVRRIEVAGIGNNVNWKSAIVGDKPITVVAGTGHVVVQTKN